MFFISIAAVVISSYLIAGIKGAEKKTGNVFFLYFLLTAFAQVVLSFEILSLFKSISKTGFLICSGVFLAAAAVVFLLKKHLQHSAEQPLKQAQRGAFWSAVKRDKALIFLSVCFVLFNILQLITIFAFPVSFGDALAYYLPRCTVWLQNGSIMHYLTPDNRELIMPVNMEFLYTWLLMFTKSESGAAIFSYTGYLGTIYVIFNLLRELNFSIRRSLWAVFVFSSFALVTMQIVTPCADLFIGGLILGSIYLFLRAVKYSDNKALFFSSLAYALAAGTKTTALIMIPSVFIIFCVIIFQHLSNCGVKTEQKDCKIPKQVRDDKENNTKQSRQCVMLNLFQHLSNGGGKTEQKEKWKYLFRFCLLFLINFLIFSSYNYILNFIQFGNPISSEEQFLVNQFTDGIKGYTANIIKYFFALFDTSGLPEFIKISGLIEYWQGLVLKAAGLSIKTGTSTYFPPYFELGNKMHMTSTFLGLTGLLIFAPSIVYAAKRAVKKIFYSKNVMPECEKTDGQRAADPAGESRNCGSAGDDKARAQSVSKKQVRDDNFKVSILMAALALSFIFNVLLFSRTMVFTGYNMRYLLSFAVIAAPVCAYSYPRHKFCKILLCCAMFLYMVINPHFKPAAYIINGIMFKDFSSVKTDFEENKIYDYFMKKDKNLHIALMTSQITTPSYYIEKLKLSGFKMNKILADNIEDYDLSEFDYIITMPEQMHSSGAPNLKARRENPNRYKAECVYRDTQQRDITNLDRPPVAAVCKIPFDYLKIQGFDKALDYEGKEYIILERYDI